MAVKRRPTAGAYQPKFVQQPSAYWRKRGLVMSFMGNRLLYSRDTPAIPTLTTTGTPKNQSGPHSDAVGFGTTYGTGANDMLTGGVLPVTVTGKRSVFTNCFRNGAGGGGTGRFFQDVTGTGLNTGESFYCTATQVIYNNYIVAGGAVASWIFVTTAPTARWTSICVTIPDLTGLAATGSCYVDGKLATTIANAGVAGGLSSNVATNLTWGNRTTTVDRNLDGMLGITHIFDTELSAEDAEKLDANANCVWEVAEVRRAVSAGGSSGTVSATNANDTVSASGTTTVVGTLAKSNANDSSSATGTTTIVGSLATSNANDSVVASGSVGSSISGTVATTNANDTSAASGTTTVTGSSAVSNANDTATASGTSTVIGTVAYANAADTSSASGIAGAITGTASVSNENDICSAAGSAGSVSAIQPSGGWTHSQARRKTRKQVYEERVRLGILPKPVVKAAAKVAAVAQTEEQFIEERPKYEQMFMEALKVKTWLPDYTRAIQAQLEIMEQEEEDLLMFL